MSELKNRLLSKVEFIPFHSCWEWIASLDSKGYGQLNVSGKIKRAHRLSWEVFNGKKLAPEEKVCHSCDNPACINPHHLWIGSQKDNMRDAALKNRVHRRQPYLTTHCNRGHKFDEKNAYIDSKNKRRCRSCMSITQREYRARGRSFQN